LPFGFVNAGEDGGRHADEGHVLTAESVEGYEEILSTHATVKDAKAALKRYKAADARRKAVRHA
jgi:hypothetical protein